MASWRVAESLEVLRKQLNEAFPKRSKISDGAVGDTRHQARKSEHNPNAAGVVRARDFTNDPKTGIDCQWLADTLVKHKDPRILYLIWNHQVCSSEKQPWKWRPYTGTNAHTKHLHISVVAEPKGYDSKKAWELDFVDDEADDVAKVIPPVEIPEPQAPPATNPEVTDTKITSKTTTVLTDDSAGKTETKTEETPSIGTRLKTSTTFIQSLGINLVAAGTGIVAFFKENKQVLIGAGVVIVLIFAIYSWRESQRTK